MIQKATGRGNWWLAASLQQGTSSWIISHAVFWQNIKSLRWLGPLQPRYGAPWLLAFPKTKITFEKQEISDHWRYSGKYDGSWWWLGELHEVPKVPTLKGTEVSSSYVQCFLYLVSSSINVYFSCYMDGYLLDRPSHGLEMSLTFFFITIFSLKINNSLNFMIHNWLLLSDISCSLWFKTLKK